MRAPFAAQNAPPKASGSDRATLPPAALHPEFQNVALGCTLSAFRDFKMEILAGVKHP
jgi:hypothetical protein